MTMMIIIIIVMVIMIMTIHISLSIFKSVVAASVGRRIFYFINWSADNVSIVSLSIRDIL